MCGHCSFLLGPGAQGSVCALQESFPQSYVSSGSSMVGLMETSSKRTYAIPMSTEPRARLCGSPQLTCTSKGGAQTQFCLRLCGVPASWCAQGLFEPSERLWQEWGLILNVNLPLLLSCCAFSFALGRGVSPHSRSSADRLTGVSLALDVGYLHRAGPAKRSHHS